jgi:hypothetical protein
MESEKTLTERIMAITNEINKRYPELTKYITEMPETNPDIEDPEINKKILREYHESLLQLIQKYKPTHVPANKEKHKL